MQNTQTLMSLHDAAQQGITSLKCVSKSKDNAIDRMEISIIDKAVGPWLNIYTKGNSEPIKELLIEYLTKSTEAYFDDKCFIPYKGGN